MLRKLTRLGLFWIAISIGQTPAFGLAPDKKPYLRAKLREFQFVEVWPALSRNGSMINVRMVVNNGLRAVPLYAEVALKFFDDKGGEIARFKRYVLCSAPGIEGGTESFYDFDIINSGLWEAAKEAKITAVDANADIRKASK